MKNLLKRTPPAVESAPAEPDRLAELRARRRELAARIEALETARGVVFPNRDVDPKRMVPSLVEAAKPYLAWSRQKLDRELDTAEHDLRKILPVVADAMEEARRATVQARKAKARELEAEHRAAVSRIADALESLTEALAEEKRLREQTCFNGVDYLPNCGLPVLGIPSNPSSPVSCWATAARRAGYLE